jgi:hypothetical protein
MHVIYQLTQAKTKNTPETTTERVSAFSYKYDNNNSNRVIDDYIKSIRIMSKRTSLEYLSRLKSFNVFIKDEFGGSLNMPDLLTKIKQGELDPYDILGKFSGYLQSSYNITNTKTACCNCKELF